MLGSPSSTPLQHAAVPPIPSRPLTPDLRQHHVPILPLLSQFAVSPQRAPAQFPETVPGCFVRNDTASLCAAWQHTRGSSGTLPTSSVSSMLLQDAMGPFTPVWGCPRQIFAGVRFFLKTFRKHRTLSAPSQAGPVVRLSPLLSPRRAKRPSVALCACAVVSGRVCGRRGVAPAPQFLICVHSGEISTLASVEAGLCLCTGAALVAYVVD